MDTAKLARAAQPTALGGYLKKNVPPAGQVMHDKTGHGVSTRTAEHNGHLISLITT